MLRGTARTPRGGQGSTKTTEKGTATWGGGKSSKHFIGYAGWILASSIGPGAEPLISLDPCSGLENHPDQCSVFPTITSKCLLCCKLGYVILIETHASPTR